MQQTVSNVYLWGPIAIALAGPTYVLGRSRFGNAVTTAFAPAVLFALAGLASSWTRWGHVQVGGTYSSRTSELVHGSLILGLAGIAGLLVAGFAHLPDHGVDA